MFRVTTNHRYNRLSSSWLAVACWVFLLFFPAQRSAAQAADPEDNLFAAVSFARLPSADFQNVAGADVLGKEHQLNLGGLGFSLGRVALSAGLDYQYTRYEFDGITGRDRDLHRLQVPFDFSVAVADWQLAGYVAPGVSTSSNVFKDLFDRGSSDDLLVSARVEGRRVIDGRNWFLGLAYDRLFGEPTLYPVLGAEFSPTAKLNLRLAFPDPAFRYQLSERLALHGRLFPAGHEWHVVSDDFSSDFNYEVEAYRAQASLSYRALGRLHVDLSLGYEFGREHRFVDDVGFSIDSAVDSHWLLSLGFRLAPAGLVYAHGSQL